MQRNELRRRCHHRKMKPNSLEHNVAYQSGGHLINLPLA